MDSLSITCFKDLPSSVVAVYIDTLCLQIIGVNRNDSIQHYTRLGRMVIESLQRLRA